MVESNSHFRGEIKTHDDKATLVHSVLKNKKPKGKNKIVVKEVVFQLT